MNSSIDMIFEHFDHILSPEWRHTKIAFELELLEGCSMWILALLNKLIPASQPAPCHSPISLISGTLSAFVLTGFLWLLHLGTKSGWCCWHQPGSSHLIPTRADQVKSVQRRVCYPSGAVGQECNLSLLFLHVLNLETDRWEENLFLEEVFTKWILKASQNQIISSPLNLLLPYSCDVNFYTIQLVSQVRKRLSNIFPCCLPTKLFSLLKYYSIYYNLLQLN